jgi:hypothetical protein
MEELKSPFDNPEYDGDGPYASWFWYGRYEGALGGYVPPGEPGIWPQLCYWLGNVIGRRFGPPHT